jgi:hypothetical protein
MQTNAQNRSYQDSQISQCPKYVGALLACSTRKVCTNLAESVNESHDVIYREMDNFAESDDTQKMLHQIAHDQLDRENIFLVLDDVKLAKMYAEEIEGLEVSYDASSKQSTLGLSMVTCLLTDRKHSIPVEAIPYVGKELAGAHYKTKTELAQVITTSVKRHFNIRRFIADAHYSTKKNIPWLYEHQIAYLMKFARNKKVTIGDKYGPLNDILRLKKNSHVASSHGELEGVPCYFYVVKIKDGSKIFFISNDLIPLDELLSLYRIRWKIEVFHRTVKQSFGMRDCQMRSMEKQRQHVLFVMHAYAIAECIRHKEEYENIETWLKIYRR